MPVTGPFDNRGFRVKWDGVYVPGISKVSGLQWSAAVVEAKSGGPPPVHSQPGQLTYEPLVIERPLDYNMAFQTWAQLVMGSVPPGPSGINKDLIVELLDAAGALVIAYQVFLCWPSGYEGLSALDAGGNVVVVEQLTLQYRTFQRDLSVAPPLI